MEYKKENSNILLSHIQSTREMSDIKFLKKDEDNSRINFSYLDSPKDTHLNEQTKQKWTFDFTMKEDQFRQINKNEDSEVNEMVYEDLDNTDPNYKNSTQNLNIEKGLNSKQPEQHKYRSRTASQLIDEIKNFQQAYNDNHVNLHKQISKKSEENHSSSEIDELQTVKLKQQEQKSKINNFIRSKSYHQKGQSKFTTFRNIQSSPVNDDKISYQLSNYIYNHVKPKIMEFSPIHRLVHINSERLRILNDKTAQQSYQKKELIEFYSVNKQIQKQQQQDFESSAASSMRTIQFQIPQKPKPSMFQKKLSFHQGFGGLNSTANTKNKSLNFTISQQPKSKNWAQWQYIKFKIKMVKLIKKIPLFEPNDKFSIAINWISLLIGIFWIFMVCTYIAFQNCYLERFSLLVFRQFSASISVIEILMRFNLSVYQRGKVIKSRWKIAKIYLQQGLFSDLIAVIVLLSNGQNCYENKLFHQILEACYFLKYQSLRYNFKNIQYRDQLYSEQSYGKQLFILLIQMIFLCHWLATIWHSCAQIEMYFGEQQTWIQQQGLVNASWQVRYTSSYYQALSTALLIGQLPPTAAEQLVTIAFLFGTVGVFAYLLSSISLIIEEIYKKECEYKNDMELINTYMRLNDIEKETQAKIRKHLEYVYQDRSYVRQDMQVKEVLKKLPKQLNSEIISEINQKLINQIQYFSDNFSEKTIQKISKIATQQTYVTNDIIIDSKTYDESDPSMYIINHGEVEICLKNESNTKIHSIKKIQQGQIFGDLSFISGNCHSITARSCSFSTVLKIKRSEFLQTIRKNKDDYEKFIFMKDEIYQNDISDNYKRTCIICSSKVHTEENCNLLSLKPNRQLTCYRHLGVLNSKCDRKRYLRPRKKMNAYTAVFILYDVCCYLMDNFHKYQPFWEQQEAIYIDSLEKIGLDAFEIYTTLIDIPIGMEGKYTESNNQQMQSSKILNQISDDNITDLVNGDGPNSPKMEVSNFFEDNKNMEVSQNAQPKKPKLFQQSPMKEENPKFMVLKQLQSVIQNQIMSQLQSPKFKLDKDKIQKQKFMEKSQHFINEQATKALHHKKTRKSLNKDHKTRKSVFDQKQRQSISGVPVIQQLTAKLATRNSIAMESSNRLPSQQNNYTPLQSAQLSEIEESESSDYDYDNNIDQSASIYQDSKLKALFNFQTTKTDLDHQKTMQQYEVSFSEFDMDERGHNFKLYFRQFNQDRVLNKIQFKLDQKFQEKEQITMYQNNRKVTENFGASSFAQSFNIKYSRPNLTASNRQNETLPSFIKSNNSFSNMV